MNIIMNIINKLISVLCVFFIASAFISPYMVFAEQYSYQLNILYDGKTLSIGNYSAEAKFGTYKVELISFERNVIETSEFEIFNTLPQTIADIIPYNEEGILINIYYPDGSKFAHVDVSGFSKYRPNKESPDQGEQNLNSISEEEVKQAIRNIITNSSNYNPDGTYPDTNEAQQSGDEYREAKRMFEIFMIVSVLAVGIMAFVVWRFKKPRP